MCRDIRLGRGCLHGYSRNVSHNIHELNHHAEPVELQVAQDFETARLLATVHRRRCGEISVCTTG